MATGSVRHAAEDFLGTRRIAVAGVSRTPAAHGGNVVYRRLRERGYEVFAVNPHAEVVEGDACYHDLGSIPGGVDAVVIATNPRDTGSVVDDCAAAGDPAHLDAPLVRRRQRRTGGGHVPGVGPV